MFDTISVVSWAVVYLLIIFCTKKQTGTPKRAIPLLPPILNLAWEFTSMIACGPSWGHIVWYSLSILVFESCLATLSKKRQIIYFGCLAGAAIVFIFISSIGGMMVSSFVINIAMSVCYWLDRKNLLQKGKILIAVFKGIGTLAATLFYAKYSLCVALLGMGIAVVDIVYLIYCIRERKRGNAVPADPKE